jgi:hypothetical protein
VGGYAKRIREMRLLTSLKGRDYSVNVGAGGCSLEKWGEKLWIVFVGLRIGTSGGLF